MIERNKHPAGRLGCILFGFACLADGLVRILSFGFLHTRFPVELAKAQVKWAFKRRAQKGLKK